ncbi:hypothetical protein [Vibrio injensis]|uniref:hypothetical protein n=1 Tax=Vibrio injensis TaxID=1307414 RepID=UPI00093256B2|nr:hypothetical protein [Vibrio injensis]
MKTQSYNVKRAFRHAGKDYRSGERIDLTPHQARPRLISGHLEEPKAKPAAKKGDAAKASNQKEAS